MIFSISLFFLVLALIAFVCAAFNVQSKINWIPVGLALWVVSILFAGR